MATILIQVGELVLAAGLAWVGVQGLRGVPDSSGKKTDRRTAMAWLVLAGLLAIGAWTGRSS
jgi:hypothetical protein